MGSKCMISQLRGVNQTTILLIEELLARDEREGSEENRLSKTFNI